MLSKKLKHSLARVADFYNQRKVGDIGALGFRRSTDLVKLIPCLDYLIDHQLLHPKESIFLDLGCADGRVNILLSYLTRYSIGIELDEWTLDEYEGLKSRLIEELKCNHLLLPQDNTFLFHGDSTDKELHWKIKKQTGIDFNEVDLYYTYLTMQEEFAELIADKAKKGAIFMVYGLEKILPQFNGFELLTPGRALEGVLGIYQKR
jgi:hypothetical protein